MLMMIRTRWDWMGASLQTAVTTMRQRQTGRTVTLVSAVHVGRPEYYAQIAALIERHESLGGIVLYEGLSSMSQEEIAGLSQEERAIYRTLAPLHELYRALAHSLGLVFQGEALQYKKDEWVNADLSLRELVQRWADSGAPLLPLGTGGTGRVMETEGQAANFLGRSLLLATPLLLRVFGGLSHKIPSIGSLRDLLVSDRNRAALDALEATDASRDALILYGAGHMPGLMEGLERRGFAKASEVWLVAYKQAYPGSRYWSGRPGQDTRSGYTASRPGERF